MEEISIKEQIEYLVTKLNYYTELYNKGESPISDKYWDDMYFELVHLENKSGIYLKDSPTQRVNYEVKNELQKVTHNHPMLSLDKTKNIEDLKSFIGNKRSIVMAKADGLTCSLYYQNGKLIRAETRGNGIIGEDITHNALVIPSIPKRINYTNDLIVDGEIICTYQDFKNFEKDYKNPRNFASGSIRLLDSKECQRRKLTFLAWDMVEGCADNEFLSTRLITLEDFGFICIPILATDIDIIEEKIEQIKIISAELGYPIDGCVIKYDKLDEYYAAGRTDHHFKGGIAFKFYDDLYETELLDIEWTMRKNRSTYSCCHI